MLVQFRCEPKDISETRRMSPPGKKVSSISHWFKAARQALPKIPDPDVGEWQLLTPVVSPTYIRWDMEEKKTGVRAIVIIDRLAPSLG